MESHSPELPLKVCRHCSVATRTDAATCPSCGKPYQRQVWAWRWWLSIPIVALAFGIGYFGISRLVDDDESGGITADRASAVAPGSSPEDVEDQLGEPPQYERKQGEGEGALSCAYYGLSNEANAVWEFCFHDDRLVSSQQLGGPAGDGTPAPPPQQ
jgi:hypothetical protein